MGKENTLEMKSVQERIIGSSNGAKQLLANFCNYYGAGIRFACSKAEMISSKWVESKKP